MGRPIVYKILEDMLKNSDRDHISIDLIDALMYYTPTAGMDPRDMYKQLVWFIDEYFEYIYGSKKELTQEMKDMS